MKLICALFAGVLLLAGCSEDPVTPSDAPRSIRFELVYPQPPTSDAYFGVSGVRLVTDEVLRDTLIRVTGRSLFAQFYTGGATLPEMVEINGVELSRHLTTDTLRLGSTTNQSLFGLQAWRLTDAQTPKAYQVPMLAEIDSVAPLMYYEPLRGDTSLSLRWPPPPSASGGVLITWRMAGVETYSKIVSDNGRFTIPKDVVARFPGESQLILTRFRTQQDTYLGRPLVLTRVAQRNYYVTILR